jgi:hypothetical protein
VVGWDRRRGSFLRVWRWRPSCAAVRLIAQRRPVERQHGTRHANHLYGVLRRGSHCDCCGVQLQRLLRNADILEPKCPDRAGGLLHSRALFRHHRHLSGVRLLRWLARDGTQYVLQRGVSPRRPRTGTGFVSGLSCLRHGCWGGMDSDAPLILYTSPRFRSEPQRLPVVDRLDRFLRGIHRGAAVGQVLPSADTLHTST